ncbi:MAG TPA: SRPBCC family protein [Armatimonadota bacterium]|nr:SRPBCC family protein [Armatimonadota bacterium]
MAHIEKTIHVNVPVNTAYNQWTQFEEFPKFMDGVHEVRQLDDRRLHWQAAVGGREKEWDAEIIEQIPDQTVAWRSMSGAANGGRVSFARLDAQSTEVTLRMDYDPDGFLESAGDALGFVSRQVEGDLQRFKEFIEQRGSETGAWRGVIHGAEVRNMENPGAPTPAGAMAGVTASSLESESPLMQERVLESQPNNLGVTGPGTIHIPAGGGVGTVNSMDAVYPSASASASETPMTTRPVEAGSPPVSDVSYRNAPAVNAADAADTDPGLMARDRTLDEMARNRADRNALNSTAGVNPIPAAGSESAGEGDFHPTWTETSMPDGTQPAPSADRGRTLEDVAAVDADEAAQTRSDEVAQNEAAEEREDEILNYEEEHDARAADNFARGVGPDLPNSSLQGVGEKGSAEAGLANAGSGVRSSLRPTKPDEPSFPSES